MANKREGGSSSQDVRRGAKLDANKKTGNRELPIWQVMPEIHEQLKTHSVVILVSETGSGKTTQIPQSLVEQGYARDGKKIIVLQNRVAVATEVAKRVAVEMGTPVGSQVGFVTGPEKNASKDSQIVFMTAGVFKNMIRRDPSLADVSIVLFDEFDERNLLMDIGVSLLEKSQESGACSTKFLLMSATLNAEKISAHFGGAPIVNAKGRPFPVEPHFADREIREQEIPESAIAKVEEILQATQVGHVLVFMPGKAEIEKIARALKERNFRGVEVVSLYGELSAEERHKAFAEYPGKRKVIVSTNIAERGVTFEGVTHVVDSGLARQKDYSPDNDTTRLGIVACAQDSLTQRRGRAGRTAPGEYHALYTEAHLAAQPTETKPEILRTALREVVMQIKAMGYSREGDPIRFIDTPAKANWKAAKNQLRLLGALDPENEVRLSAFGEQLAELGCDPREGTMILKGCEMGCGGDAIALAALRSSRRLVTRSDALNNFRVSAKSDLLNLLALYRMAEEERFSYKWCRENFVSPQALQEVRKNIDDFTKRADKMGYKVKSTTHAPEKICEAVISGLPDKLFVAEGSGYYRSLSTNERIQLGRESSVRGELIAASEVTTIQPPGKRAFTVISQATTVDPAYIREYMPQMCEDGTVRVYYDKTTDEVKKQTKLMLKGSSYSLGERLDETTEDEAAEVFAKALANGEVDLPCYKYNQEITQKLERLFHRSRGRVKKPDFTAMIEWYKEKLGGASSKKEAGYIDEQLRLSEEKFYSPEMRADLEKNYPETVQIGSDNYQVSYYYKPEQKSYYGDMPEEFIASINVEPEILFSLEQADLTRLGAPITIRSNSDSDTDVERLKERLENKELDAKWYSWIKPEIQPMTVKVLEQLPPTVSEPIQYATKRNGDPVFAYPATQAYSGSYDENLKDYRYQYYVAYFKNEAEAQAVQKQAENYRAQEMVKEQALKDREELARPARELFEEVKKEVDEIRNGNIFSASELRNLDGDLRQAELHLSGKDTWGYTREIEPRQAMERLDAIRVAIEEKKTTAERKKVLLPKVLQTRDQLQPLVDQIYNEGYETFGLSYDDQRELSDKWYRANNLLDEQGGQLDPEVAERLLEEIRPLLGRSRVVIRKPEYSRVEETIEPARGGGLGSLADAFQKGKGDKKGAKAEKKPEIGVTKPEAKAEKILSPEEIEADRAILKTELLALESLYGVVPTRSVRKVKDKKEQAEIDNAVSAIKERRREIGALISALRELLEEKNIKVDSLKGKIADIRGKILSLAKRKEMPILIGAEYSQDWVIRFNDLWDAVPELVEQSEVAQELVEEKNRGALVKGIREAIAQQVENIFKGKKIDIDEIIETVASDLV